MNVLMMVTWNSPADAETIQAGVFHYEQSMDLKQHCNVALYYPFDGNMSEAFSAKEEKGLYTYRSRQESGKGIKNKIRIFRDFKRIYKEFRPDIIHAHVAVGAGIYAVLLGKLYKIPVVLTEHNPAKLAGYANKITRNIAGYAYSHTQFNACVSPHNKEELSRIFPRLKFDVVYNGVVAPKLSEETVSYKKEGYVNAAIVAAFYNEWVKGYQFLLPALKELTAQGCRIMLHIIGGGIYLEKYQKLAEELGISEYCIFYGSCEKKKVYDIVSQMDFCLSTSLIESAGVSVQEAMMLGKPMVVTRSGGANSLVTPGTAIVVDKESVSAIVDGVKEMIDRRSDFKDDEIKGYAYQNFEIGGISRKYMQIYEEILKGRESE